MFKRIALFVLTNILVIVTISIVLSLLGVQPYLSAQGINYESLLVFCLIWGMGGAFISLQMSRWSAKWMLGVKVVGGAGKPTDPQFASLVQMVERISKQAQLPVVPEIGIYNSPEVNAFATGPSKRRSLVAFSTGLLQQMDQDAIEGVAAHEIAHIRNGDMVTMTLLQGVVNAFVMFIARVVAYFAAQAVRDDGMRHMVHIGVMIVLEILLSFLGMIVVFWFSRHREFRADEGGARLSSRAKMVGALQALQRMYGRAVVDDHASLATLKISSKRSKFGMLFASHPPLEQRIAALERARIA